jgi:hypothetical protein
MSTPWATSAPVTSSATPDVYTAWAVPMGVCELKMTMLACGRAAMLRECAASGDETQ